MWIPENDQRYLEEQRLEQQRLEEQRGRRLQDVLSNYGPCYGRNLVVENGVCSFVFGNMLVYVEIINSVVAISTTIRHKLRDTTVYEENSAGVTQEWDYNSVRLNKLISLQQLEDSLTEKLTEFLDIAVRCRRNVKAYQKQKRPVQTREVPCE